MKVIKTNFQGILLIQNELHFDTRGYLKEIFSNNKIKFKNKFQYYSISKKNVFRGLHFQRKKQQEKIVVVVNGEVVDYCLDLRRRSETFGKIFKFKLKKNSILFIPKGFAHGYLTLKDNTQMIYLLSEMRFKKFEKTLSIFDKKFNLRIKKNYIISQKDKKGISFNLFQKKIRTL